MILLRLRVDGARPPTVIQRVPPPRAAANEPPRTAAATIAEVRRVAQQRLMLLPRLHTKTAQRRATDLGELISFSSQRENQCELAGLKWLDVAPEYAIEGRLGDTITNLVKRVFITNVKGTFLGMSESEEASKRR